MPLQDMWTDIGPIGAQAQEQPGYPTQKSMALLERIILASSNEGAKHFRNGSKIVGFAAVAPSEAEEVRGLDEDLAAVVEQGFGAGRGGVFRVADAAGQLVAEAAIEIL